MSVYVPPNPREHRPILNPTLEAVAVVIILGSILVLSIYGAAVTSPLPGMLP